jgi:hypothetical protein
MGNVKNQKLIENMEALGIEQSQLLNDLNIKIGLDSSSKPFVKN